MFRAAKVPRVAVCEFCSARCYASKPASQQKGVAKNRGSRLQEGSSDARLDSIRQILFESEPSEDERLKALQKAVPSLEAHETIERAWQLYRRHERERHSAELDRKKKAMDEAVELLKEVRPDWYKAAVTDVKRFDNVDQSNAPKSGSRLVNLFPREYKIPTEEAGPVVWDQSWTPPDAPAQKTKKQ